MIGAKLDEIFPDHDIKGDRRSSATCRSPSAASGSRSPAPLHGVSDAPVRLVILDEPTSSLDAGHGRATSSCSTSARLRGRRPERGAADLPPAGRDPVEFTDRIVVMKSTAGSWPRSAAAASMTRRLVWSPPWATWPRTTSSSSGEQVQRPGCRRRGLRARPRGRPQRQRSSWSRPARARSSASPASPGTARPTSCSASSPPTIAATGLPTPTVKGAVAMVRRRPRRTERRTSTLWSHRLKQPVDRAARSAACATLGADPGWRAVSTTLAAAVEDRRMEHQARPDMGNRLSCRCRAATSRRCCSPARSPRRPRSC